MTTELKKLVAAVTAVVDCAQFSKMDQPLQNEIRWFINDYKVKGDVTLTNIQRLEKSIDKMNERITNLKNDYRIQPDKLTRYQDAFAKADKLDVALKNYQKAKQKVGIKFPRFKWSGKCAGQPVTDSLRTPLLRGK